MHVLVTGATGFIGRHMAHALRARGDDVSALVRPTSDAWKVEALRRQGVTIHPGDVTDRATILAALDDADALVHCAAFVRLGRVDPAVMHNINVQGTENALGAAHELGVRRVLHTSSIAALGLHGDREADEHAPHSGQYHSAYEESKHKATLVADRFAADGLPVVQAFPSVVFGRGDPNFGVFFKRYVRRRIPFIPGPETLLSFVHVADLADGMVRALDHGTRGQRFLFTQAHITIRELFDRVAAATGIPAPRLVVPSGVARAGVGLAALLTRPLPPSRRVRRRAARILGTTRRYSNRNAVLHLGWAPGDFDERLADTARYYAIKYGPPGSRERLAPLIPDPPLAAEATT